jgi:UDP-glucose 4-epimerase
MTGPNILVTGASGFIGRYVVECLAASGFTPIGLDRHRKAGQTAVMLGDVTRQLDVTQAVEAAEGVIHLAGVLGTQETMKAPWEAAAVNVGGICNVLGACHAHGVPLINIGVGNHWMLNPYAITKNAAEQLCTMSRREVGTNVTTVRGLNAYGPRQLAAAPYGPSKVRKIVPTFIARALADHPIEVYGDGTQVMDMVHVADLAAILVQTLIHAKANGPVDFTIEAGPGRQTTVVGIARMVAELVATETGRGIVPIDYLPMRPGEPEHAKVLADPATLSVIGWDASTLRPLEDGLAETVRWYVENER